MSLTKLKNTHNIYECTKIILSILKHKIYLLTFIILCSGIVDIIGISMFAPLLSTITDNLSSNKITRLTSNFFNLFNLELNLLNISILLSIIFIVKGMLVFLTRKYIYDIIENIKAELRNKTIQSLLRANYSFVNLYKSGYLTNILSTEIEKVAATVKVFANMLTCVCWTIIFFIGSLALAPLATLIIILGWIFISLLIKVMSNSLRILSLDLSQYDFFFLRYNYSIF